MMQLFVAPTFAVGGLALVRCFLLLLVTLACWPARATDLTLPGINLGGTSFEDGAGGIGHAFQWTTSYTEASRLYDAEGDRRDLKHHRALWVSRLHYLYTSPHMFLGGNLGGDVLLPLIDMDMEIGPARLHKRGMGNPVLGVYLQWLNRRLFDRPFASRLSLVALVPWGDYDRDASLNLGTDYYSLNPYYAFTLRTSDRWELSGRLMYLWNGRSDDPETRLHTLHRETVRTVQPGQALHSNLSASYALNAQWRLGIGLYHLQQITNDRINGEPQVDSKERILGLGPGVQWRSGPNRLVANLYAESMARNRAAGSQLVLRYMRVF
ncbi:transporter [Pseudomonas sp. GD03944]|uniref:SphA family protein n=1 Tax=Pseudomonas sp. GD03944 TaxID=2975409 RepID=UPI0024491DBB|nr:transporter [Pseudomonas sp. GD03944]MDH1264276.1 transporter [Pseudomonas sp. GD03944]